MNEQELLEKVKEAARRKNTDEQNAYCKNLTEFYNNDVESIFNRGEELFSQKDYLDAIIIYGIAMKIDFNYPNLINKICEAYKALGLYNSVIDTIDILLKYEPLNTSCWNARGAALTEMKQFEAAIRSYDEAIRINPNDEIGWYNKGTTYIKCENYKEALNCCEEAIKIKPDFWQAWDNKGGVFYYLNEYEKALECYNKAIEFTGETSANLCNKASILACLERNNEALELFDKALKLDPYDVNTLNNVSNLLLDLEKYEELVVNQYNGGRDTFAIICLFPNNYTNLIPYLNVLRDQYYIMLAGDKNEYKDIYLKSLLIVSKLFMSSDSINKLGISHYTTQKSATKMLRKDENTHMYSPIRLSSIDYCNDPEEGKTLLELLKLDIPDKKDDIYRVFAGSFVANPDSLTMYRLYGNDASGVSITLKPSFFENNAKLATRNIALPLAAVVVEKPEIKYSLYRCIYIDPKKNKIISVGHGEDEDYENWHKLVDELNELLKQLREEIEKVQDKGIVAQLLLHLRYVCKHSAFKDEQECRMAQVINIKEDNNVKVDEINQRLYIDYLPIRKYVEKIHLAPKMLGRESFRDVLMREGYENVELSDVPLI